MGGLRGGGGGSGRKGGGEGGRLVLRCEPRVIEVIVKIVCYCDFLKSGGITSQSLEILNLANIGFKLDSKQQGC